MYGGSMPHPGVQFAIRLCFPERYLVVLVLPFGLVLPGGMAVGDHANARVSADGTTLAGWLAKGQSADVSHVSDG